MTSLENRDLARLFGGIFSCFDDESLSNIKSSYLTPILTAINKTHQEQNLVYLRKLKRHLVHYTCSDQLLVLAKNRRPFTIICKNDWVHLASWIYTFGNIQKSELDRAFQVACEYGAFSTAKWLAENPLTDIFSNNFHSLKKACANNHQTIVQWLFAAEPKLKTTYHILADILVSCDDEYFENWWELFGGDQLFKHEDNLILKNLCSRSRISSVKFLLNRYPVNIYAGDVSVANFGCSSNDGEVMEYLFSRYPPTNDEILQLITFSFPHFFLIVKWFRQKYPLIPDDFWNLTYRQTIQVIDSSKLNQMIPLFSWLHEASLIEPGQISGLYVRACCNPELFPLLKFSYPLVNDEFLWKMGFNIAVRKSLKITKWIYRQNPSIFQLDFAVIATALPEVRVWYDQNRLPL